MPALCRRWPRRPRRLPHYLVFTATYGFRHDGIQEAVAEIQRMAAETRAFTVEVTDDAAALAPETYERVDGVILVNTTGLGGGSLAAHATQQTDRLRRLLRLRRRPRRHPRRRRLRRRVAGVRRAARLVRLRHATRTSRSRHATTRSAANAFNPAVITDVTIQVEDPDHVTTRPWQGFDSFRITEELYRYKGDPRADERLHVVLSLDEESHYWRSEIGPGPAAGGLAPSVAEPGVEPGQPRAADGDARRQPGGVGEDLRRRTTGASSTRTSATAWRRGSAPDFQGHLLAGIEWVSAQRPDRRLHRVALINPPALVGSPRRRA